MILCSLKICAGNVSITNELAQVNKGSCEALLKFLHAQEPVLGPNNHHLVEVKNMFEFIAARFITVIPKQMVLGVNS